MAQYISQWNQHQKLKAQSASSLPMNPTQVSEESPIRPPATIANKFAKLAAAKMSTPQTHSVTASEKPETSASTESSSSSVAAPTADHVEP